MATTLTLAVLSPNGPVEVAHVGDSRAYLANGSNIVQVTEDHTHGMDRVVAGELSLEEAQQDPDWHVMSNWLGFESYRVATYRVPVESGDRLLLCSDGLSNMLTNDQIAEILNTGTVERSAAALIDAANEAGGLDNITVVVVEVLKG
jgi:protein phosphatase